MVIDSHAHLNDKAYEADRDEVVLRSFSEGVGAIICVGTNLEDSKQAISLAQKYPGVYASVGIYPLEEVSAKDFRQELSVLALNPKVIAIGECGLDYSDKDGRPAEEQKDLLRRQVGTAIQLDLPLIIHNREADEDLILELSRYKNTGKLRGVFHCFTQTEDFARKVLQLGFHISFTAIITYPSAKHLENAIKSIPLDRILIETDSPYLSPQQYRGQRNEPKNVRIVASHLARILNISQEEIEDATSKNTQRLFRLN